MTKISISSAWKKLLDLLRDSRPSRIIFKIFIVLLIIGWATGGFRCIGKKLTNSANKIRKEKITKGNVHSSSSKKEKEYDAYIFSPKPPKPPIV